ncbi:hypothetical protein FB2170_11311 [Maribacter sp. HTCC2170]|nr:hypothetical protein FB2170_11311 [Maribacter sp. HTCC2170]
MSLLRKRTLQTVFSLFSNESNTSEILLQTESHEIRKYNDGFVLILHQEKETNQKLWFSDKQLLDVYLRTL